MAFAIICRFWVWDSINLWSLFLPFKYFFRSAMWSLDVLISMSDSSALGFNDCESFPLIGDLLPSCYRGICGLRLSLCNLSLLLLVTFRVCFGIV